MDAVVRDTFQHLAAVTVINGEVLSDLLIQYFHDALLNHEGISISTCGS